jgi:ferrochelatase
MPRTGAASPSPPQREPRSGVLLVNLGTPPAPTAAALRRYLGEFLADPRVVELPRAVWLPILHGVILNTRPKKSAAKYAKIWMQDEALGSPLAVHTERQAKLLRGVLGEAGLGRIEVAWAMRYGQPAVAAVLDDMRSRGCTRILVVPLYPQYAASTTASAMDAVAAWLLCRRDLPELRFIRDFHDDANYIAALAAGIQAAWMREGRPDRLVMSFHGLPQRTVALGDPYYRECMETGQRLAQALGLAADRYLITFQSRFGAAKWLQPYTQATLEKLARDGVGRVDVVCPGFVSDCLETLEEIAIECKAAFLAAGGKEFHYLPCLNESDAWIAALAGLVRENMGNWLSPSAGA